MFLRSLKMKADWEAVICEYTQEETAEAQLFITWQQINMEIDRVFKG